MQPSAIHNVNYIKSNRLCLLLLIQDFEMIFLEILPSANMAGFPRVSHIYMDFALKIPQNVKISY